MSTPERRGTRRACLIYALLCAPAGCDDLGGPGDGPLAEGDDVAVPPPDVPHAEAVCTGWEAGGRTCVARCEAEPGLWHPTGAKWPAIAEAECPEHAEAWCVASRRGRSTQSCWGFLVHP